MSIPPAIVIRSAADADMARVQAIYAGHVLTGTASFEEEPPDLAETCRRRDAAMAVNLPYRVADRGGIGRALLARVLELAAASGYREMIAIIGDSANAASIGLHRTLGFAHVGTFSKVGFKFGRWLDSVLGLLGVRLDFSVIA